MSAEIQKLTEAVWQGDQLALVSLLDSDPGLVNVRIANGVSLLLFCLYNGQEKLVPLILSRGHVCDVFEAAALGDSARLKDLIEDPETEVNAFAADGFSPLHLATFFSRIEAVSLLIGSGADPNSRAENGNLRPLHSAVAGRIPENIETILGLLLDAGADVNVPQEGGFTALHGAAFGGNERAVRTLVERGADKTLKTEQGETSADLALGKGHLRIAEYLRTGT